MARVKGKAIKARGRISMPINQEPDDIDDEDGMVDPWKKLAIGTSVFAPLKVRMATLLPDIVKDKARLIPQQQMSGISLEACYTCLLRGLIDIEENGGLDFDEIEEKGLLRYVMDRGAALYTDDFTHEVAQAQRAKKAADEREDRYNLAESSVNRKSLPAPASQSPRGGSDSTPGRRDLGLRIPNQIVGRRRHGVHGAQHKD
jgi:hypothetical protein